MIDEASECRVDYGLMREMPHLLVVRCSLCKYQIYHAAQHPEFDVWAVKDREQSQRVCQYWRGVGNASVI